MLLHTNLLKAINTDYRKARAQAKVYIIENCFWSERTYYRKMENKQALTNEENEVVANAFKKFIHPVLEVFNPEYSIN